MNRRNLFKLIAGAACAAAIELTGVRPAVPRFKTFITTRNWDWPVIEDEIILPINAHYIYVRRMA